MIPVRMGEMAVSVKGGDELVALGLGSCIGLSLIDSTAGVAGLAHIVLPSSTSRDAEIGKFADLAVPELLARVLAAGAARRRLDAVLVGGACMFEVGELDVGARNEAAVRAALVALRLRVVAVATGGNRGRTVRIAPGSCELTVKEAGGESITLYGGVSRRPSRIVPVKPGVLEARR